MKPSPKWICRLGSLLLACFVATDSTAAVIVEGRAADARAAVKGIQPGMETKEFEVPLPEKEVIVELVVGNTATKAPPSWTTKTDAEGKFSVDTGLERLPADARFVAHIRDGSQHLYSPFFKKQEKPETLFFYETTDDPQVLRARVQVEYNVDSRGDVPSLHVHITAIILNVGERLYVGRLAPSGQREILRVPLPEGAKVVSQKSPDPDSSGWKKSEDSRWLILDTPIPGAPDLKRQGYHSQSGWEVTYVLPGQQTFVQSFPVTLPLSRQDFAVWCLNKDQSLLSPQLDALETQNRQDPLTGKTKAFDVRYTTKGVPVGSSVTIALNTDNLLLKQVSVRAALWVGSFGAAILLALILGLVFAARGPAPEVLFANLSGEEVLDRIVDLDRRFERGQVREKEYRRHRETLVQLASEELGEPAAASSSKATSAAAAPSLPEGATSLLERIDELDRSGSTEPAAITERIQLLEALYKTLSRTPAKTAAGENPVA